VDLNHLLSPELLGLLYEPEVFGSFSTAFLTPFKYGSEDLYEVIFPKIGGDIESQNLEMEDLMSAQRAGTCAWKSLTAVLRKQMTTLQQYKVFMYAIGRESLFSYYQHNQNKIATDPTARHLIEKTLQSQTETLENLYKAGCIEKEVFDQDMAELVQLKKVFAEKKIAALHTEQSQTPTIPTTPVAPQLEPLSKIETEMAQTAAPKSHLAQIPKLFVQDSSIINWSPAQNTLVQDLGNFTEQLKAMAARGDHAQVLSSFHKILKKIPLTSSFLEEVAKTAPKEVIEQLSDLQDVAMQSVYQWEGSPKTIPTTCVMALSKAAAINHYLIIKADSTLTELSGLQLPVDMNYLYQLLGEDLIDKGTYFDEPPIRTRNTGFQLPDPDDILEMRKISNYFKRFTENNRALDFAFPTNYRVVHHSSPFSSSIGGGIDYNSIIGDVFNEDKPPKEIEYLLNMASKPEIESKILQLNPNYPSLPPEERICFLYKNAEQLFPSTYLKWRRQIGQLQCYLHSTPLSEKQKETDLNYVATVLPGPPLAKKQLKIGPNHPAHPIAPPITGASKGTKPTFELTSKKLDVKTFRYAPHAYHLQVLRAILFFQDRCVYAENDPVHTKQWKEKYGINQKITHMHNRIAILSKKDEAPIPEYAPEYSDPFTKDQSHLFKELPLSDEELRELLLIGVNEGIQISQLLAYFTRHPERVSDPLYLTFFFLELFDRDLLIQQLRRHPHFVLILRSFIRTHFKIAKEKGDATTASALLEIDQRLESYWNVATKDWSEEQRIQWKEETTGKPGSKPLNWIENLNRLLRIVNLKPSERSLVYARLIASCEGQETLDKTTLKNVLKGISHLRIHPLSGLQEDPTLIYHIQSGLSSLIPILQKVFVESSEMAPSSSSVPEEKINMDGSAQKLLNTIYSNITKEKKTYTWENSGFPLFTADEGKIVLNLLTGDARNSELCFTGIPSRITEDRVFTELFPTPPSSVKFLSNIHQGTYEFLGEDGKLYRTYDGQLGTVILKEIDGKWYRYASDFKWISSIHPESNILRNQSRYWISEDQTTVIAYPKNFSVAYKLQLSIESQFTVTQKDDYGYRISQEDENRKEKQMNQLGIKGRRNVSQNEQVRYKVERITLINAAGETTDRHLVNPDPRKNRNIPLKIEEHPYAVLNTIFGSSQVHLWADSTNQPRHIEIPTLDLDFDLKNSRWECRQIQGFYLARDPYVEILGKTHITQYLKLVNQEGEERVLLLKYPPYRSLGSRTGSALHGRIAFDEASAFIQLMVVKKSARSEVKLLGDSEALFYLAYRMLISGDEEGYQAAREMLKEIHLPFQAGKSGAGSAEKELEILQWIIDLGMKNGDHDPRAVALRLQARLLSAELIKRAAREGVSLFKHIEDSQKNQTAFGEDLQAYASAISHTPTFKLSAEDEIRLLQLSKEEKIPLIGGAYFYFEQSLGTEQLHSLRLTEQAAVYEKKQSFEPKILQTASHYASDLRSELDRACTAMRKDQDGKVPLPVKRMRPQGYGMAAIFIDFIQKADANALRRSLELARFDETPASQILRAALTMMLDFPEEFPPLQISDLPKSEERDEWNKVLNSHVYPACKKMAELEKDKEKFMTIGTQQRTLGGFQEIVRKGTLPGEGSKSHSPSALSHKRVGPETELSTKPLFDLQNYCLPPLTAVSASSSAASSSGGVSPRISAVKESCQEIFEGSPEIEVETNRLKEGLETFVAKKQQQESSLKANPEKLAEMQEELLRLSQYKRSQLAYQEEEILAISASLVASVEQLKGSVEPDTIDDICLKLATNKLKDLILRDKAIAYLELATEIQQHERTLDLIESWQKLEKTEANQALEQELLTQIIQSESAERIFKSQEHPEMLLLEYLQNMKIRADQYANVELLLQGKAAGNPIIQAIMGSGKTSVLTTLLALRKCNGDNLSVILLPQELLESMSEEIRMRLGSHWQQSIHPLPISRTSNFDIPELQRILTLLNQTRANKQCLLMSTKSIHCLFLKYHELIAQAKKAQAKGEAIPEQLKQIELLREICNTFKTKGSALLDEVDLQLTSRVEVNFPIGSKSRLSKEDSETTLEIYDILLNHPEINDLLKFDFYTMAGASKEARLYNKEIYETRVKPLLAQEFLRRLADPSYEGLSLKPEVKANLVALLADPETGRKLYNYLMLPKDRQTRAEAQACFSAIPDREIRNLLSLAKKEFNGLIPLTLKKKCSDEYKIDWTKELSIANPYRNGRPVVGSKFDSHHATANFTIQAVLHSSIPDQRIKKIIKRLKSEALRDMKDGKIAFKETNAYKAYCHICQDPEKYHLLKMKKEHVLELTKQINSSPVLRRRLISNFILPEIEFHRKKLNSNAQNLVNFFDEITGFSGTLWNSRTYHPRLTAIPDNEADAKTIYILMDKVTKVDETGEITRENHVTELEDEEPATLLSVINEGLKKGSPTKALLDAGGYLNDIDISKVTAEWAANLSSNDPRLKGLCYHDDSSSHVMREIAEGEVGEPIPFRKSPLKPEERFTIYRQPFTTGTHIEQSEDAEAFVTVGRNILMRDLSQTVWRMRKIERGQSVRFVVSKDVADVIRTTLGLDKTHKINDADIIRFAIYNETMQVKEDKFVSISQQMTEVIQKAVMDLLMDTTIPVEMVLELYNTAVEAIFSQTSPVDACDLYGQDEEEVPVAQAMEQILDQNRALLDAVLNSHQIFRERLDGEKIDEQMKACINLHGVKEMVTMPKQKDLGQLIELEKEKEKEKQKLKEQLQLDTSETEFSKNKPWVYQEWKGSPPARDHAQNIHRRKGESQAASSSQVRQLPPPPNTPYSYPIEELLGKNEAITPLLPHLYSDIYVTTNWAPPMAYAEGAYVAQPFNDLGKPNQNLLVLMDTTTGRFDLVVGDTADIETFTKDLASDKATKQNLTEGRLTFIYNLDIGITQIGASTQTDGAVIDRCKNDLAFQGAIAQLKLLSGHFNFTKEQRKLLKQWIRQIGPEIAKTAYLNSVLAHSSNRDEIWMHVKELFEDS